MNSAKPSKNSNRQSNKSPLALTLTLVLSLTLLTSCTTQRLIENQKSKTEYRQTQSASSESSIINHQSLIDSIHILTTETIWLPPDTLGHQYPLKTIRRETGKQTKTQTNQTIHQNDTIYIQSSTNQQSSTTNYQPPTTNTWLPWLIIVGMVIVALIILAIRIFLIKL